MLRAPASHLRNEEREAEWNATIPYPKLFDSGNLDLDKPLSIPDRDRKICSVVGIHIGRQSSARTESSMHRETQKSNNLLRPLSVQPE